MIFSVKWFSLAILLFGLACSRHAKETDESKTTTPVVEVKVDSLVLGNVDDGILVTGHTDVLIKETISSPMAGRLVALNVSEGDVVHAGETVATVRTRESESVIEGAQALLRQAKTVNEKQDAKHAVELAITTQNQINLKTKLNGVVSGRWVQEGNLINENESLLTVLDLSTLDFQAEIPLTETPKIRVHMSATISLQALPGLKYLAEIMALSPQANTSSQTFSARLKIKSESKGAKTSGLKADMTGEAFIILGNRKGVLLAPKKAMLRNDDNKTVSLVIAGPDSIAHVLLVQVGASQGDRQEVSGEGIAKGVKIIVEGQYGLTDSTRIRITQ